MQKVVLATGNAGKVRELASLLSDFGLDVVAQTDLGVDSAEETGLTFIENAILKARHAAQITGLPAIADDSGLAVNALGGAPGIYSARYSGEDATDQQNLENCSTPCRMFLMTSARHNSTACWCICAMQTIQHLWFATDAGRALLPVNLPETVVLATTQSSLCPPKGKPPPN